MHSFPLVIISLFVFCIDFSDAAIDTLSIHQSPMPQMKHGQGENELRLLMNKIELNIRLNSIGTMGQYFNSIVSIMVLSREKGNYSARQSLAILSAFFKERRIISFEFSKMSSSAPNPYATGRIVFLYKGEQITSQIYVSLRQHETQWMISQFHIY
jgi:hypothetical protein